MNEFKRCISVFSHSPFKVRLMLIGMLCDLFNNKPEQDTPSRYAASRRRFITLSSFAGNLPVCAQKPRLFSGFVIVLPKQFVISS